jgi:GlcNAc-P-P-Und epimerase
MGQFVGVSKVIMAEIISMQRNNAFVLGASGFIGTRLVKALVKRAVTGVYAWDIQPPRERLRGVDYCTHDIRLPISAEYGAGSSIIYNLAAVHRTPGHPDYEYFETNVAGALNTVAFADAHGIKTIVFTSSISVYGASEETILETTSLKPVSSYGRSKVLAERIHEHWLRQGHGRRLIVIRPGRVMKLVQSTKVAPGWLQANGYHLSTNLRTALKSWSDETQGKFD